MVAVATQQTRARLVLMPLAMFALSLMALSPLCVGLDATGSPSRATATDAASVASAEKKGPVHQAAEHPRHRQAALASTKEVPGASHAARGIVRKAAEHPRHGEAALASTKEVVDASHATRDGAPIAGYLSIASTALASILRGKLDHALRFDAELQMASSLDINVEINGATSRFQVLASPTGKWEYGCVAMFEKFHEQGTPGAGDDLRDMYHFCVEKPGSSSSSVATSDEKPAMRRKKSAEVPSPAATGEDEVIFKKITPGEGVHEMEEFSGKCSTAKVTVCNRFFEDPNEPEKEAKPEECEPPLTDLRACGDGIEAVEATS